MMALASRLEMTVIDPDCVDLSNLQRQILYRASDVCRLKVECAAERLQARHPSAIVRPLSTRLDQANGLELIASHDVVIDGSDSFATRFLVNDLCLEAGVPLVHGAVLGLTGQLMTVVRGHACYRCIFEAPPDAPESCQDAGVLGALCGVIGGWMATEALAAVHHRPSLAGTLRVFDGRSGVSRDIKPRRRGSCPAHLPAEVATW
jgi:adenylyltransferase/sulfurtransferase